MFQLNKSEQKPLAERMRPDSLETFVGYESLFNRNGLLKQMFDQGRFRSMILWGAPGSGKTTIARLIKKVASNPFHEISAVHTGSKAVRDIFGQAERHLKLYQQSSILFVDEIHRFNKKQQDLFLHHLEDGVIILIGATTEKPVYSINPALLSRVYTVGLTPLSEKELEDILMRGGARLNREIPEGVIAQMAEASCGDARYALNLLEQIVATFPELIPETLPEESIQQKKPGYDQRGHYDAASGLQKAIRGSDPDGALYWLGRMLVGGEDPLFILRRLMVIASEDIGMADPNGLLQVVAAKNVIESIGLPEGRITLAQAVVYLATAPKSNSVYLGIDRAIDLATKTGHLAPPSYIQPGALDKKDYQYPHDFPNRYTGQNYLPEQLKGTQFYTPSGFGFERDIEKRLQWWNKIKSEIQS